MSGIGEMNLLNEGQIKSAFDEAKADGKDFLVKIRCASSGEAMTRSNCPVILDLIDFTEKTHGVGKATATEDLRKIYESDSFSHIASVYDLSLPFSHAAGGPELLPQDALQTVLSGRATVSATPWWKTILGL